MGGLKNTFERFEIKYLVTEQQRARLLSLIEKHMKPDEFGEGCICNLYYDTPDRQLIRRSLERPVYKEKLRIRSYGPAQADSAVFVELKKKFDGIVYKRRVCMIYEQALPYLEDASCGEGACQITREIDYFKSHYARLSPSMFICYERQAFYGLEDPDFRLTFDRNLLYRDYDLTLCKEPYGSSLLDSGVSLMEVKISSGMPLWLARELSAMGVFKTSYSKYGTAYTKALAGEKERSIICA